MGFSHNRRRADLRRALLGTTALVAASVAIFAGAGPAHAQSTWQTGAGDTTDYKDATNWNNLTPPVAAGQSAIFANSGSATIVVPAAPGPDPIAPDSWTFTAGAQGYSISGAGVSFSLAGPTGGIVNNASTDQTIANNIGESVAGVQVQHLGGGVLTLAGSNSYTGGTTVNFGTLQVTNNNSVGNGPVTLEGGLFKADGLSDLSFSNNFTINNTFSTGSTFDGNGTTLRLSGVIADGTSDINGRSAMVTFMGSGKTILTGDNTYTGGTIICLCSTLQIGDGGPIGSILGNVANGGTLIFNRSDSYTFNGIISDDGTAGKVEQLGTGTTVLSGVNTYSGGTTITAGALEVTNASSVGSGTVTFNGGTFRAGANLLNFTNPFDITAAGGTFDTNGNTLTISGSIDDGVLGAGGLSKIGEGTLVLSGANGFSGGTTITAGTVMVTDSVSVGSGAVTLNGGTFRLSSSISSVNFSNDFKINTAGGVVDNNGALLELSGIISNGTGSPPGVLQLTDSTGGGVTLLSGVNIYTGGTKVVGTTLQVDNNSSVGTGLVTLEDGVFQAADTIATPTLAFSNNFAINNTPSGSAIDVNGYSLTISGNIADGSGPGKLTVADAFGGGVLILTGTATHTGGTEICECATLQIGTAGVGGVTGSISGAIVNFGFLDFVNANTAGITEIRNTSLGFGAGTTTFYNTQSAGTAAITNEFGGGTVFGNYLVSTDAPTASGATIVNVNGGYTEFNSQATAGEAKITNNNFGTTDFYDFSTAGNATITTNAGGATYFSNNSTGGSARFITSGTGFVDFGGSSGPLGNGVITAGSIAGSGAYYIGGFNRLVVGGNNDSTEVSGLIADFDPCGCGTPGPGALEKEGTGTLILSGVNTYTGGTFVTAGTLLLSGVGTLGATTGMTTVTGGTLDLGGTNQTQSGLTLTGGSVQNGTFTSAGTFDVQAGTISAMLAGGGNLSKSGPGTVTLSDNNSFTGGTTVSAGTLQLSGAGTLGATTGFTTVTGGTLDLGGTNQTQSGLTLTGGSVQNGTFTSAGTFDVQAGTISAMLAGGGNLSKFGSGVVTLTGNNSFTGGSTTSGGTLILGHNNALGTAGLEVFSSSTLGILDGITISNNATLRADVTFNVAAGAGTYAGNISQQIFESGPPGISKTGTGTLTLSGTNTYAGLTTVDAGTLLVNGTLTASNVTANSGATFGGTGTVANSVTIANGATLAPGNSPGTITVGSLTLNPGSILAYELGTANVIGGATNDLTNVTGALRLDGTLNVTDAGGFGLGAYRLMNYGGAFTDNSLVVGTLPGAFSGSVETAIPGQVNLVVSAPGVLVQYWDGPDAIGNGAINGGTGTWNNVATNWTAPNGVINSSWQNGFAIFAGAAGTVTVGQPLSYKGMQFTVGGYSIVGGTLNPTGVAPIRVDSGVTAIIAAPIVGIGGVAKTDPGTLVLSGVNTYSGGTVISAGALEVTNNSSVGAGEVRLDGGTFRAGANDLNFANSFAINTTGGVIDTGTNRLTISGTIADGNGSGAVTKVGTGTLVFTGTNTYTGGTSIAGGVLRLGDGGTAGSILGDVANNATLVINRSDAFTFGGVISGTGAFRQDGPGTTILTAQNTYAGGTIISGGTLQLGNGGATGSVVGNITDNGTLAINRSDNFILSNVIFGTGAFQQNGTGITRMTGDNTYGGGTTISAGTLQLGAGGAGATSGSIVGNVLNNAILAFGRSDAMTFSGVISGTGTVVQQNSGTTTLSATNTYSGGTILNNGILAVSSNANLGAASGGLTFNGGTLRALGDFNAARSVVLDAGGGTIGTNGFNVNLTGVISGAGGLTKSGAGILGLIAGETYTGGTTISGGALRLGNGGTTGSILGDVVNNAALTINRSDAYTFTGLISGTGAFNQIGTGTTVFTANNTYTGGTTISAGALQLGNGGSTGSIAGDVTDNGALAFNRSNGLTFGGVISGTGAVQQNGTGTTTFTGANTYTGGTTISAGTLQLGNGGSAGSIAGDVTDNGMLAFNRSNALTFGGVVSGTGAVNQIGTGTTVFTGSNTYTGGTTISAGTLQLGNGGTSGSVVGNIADNGVLAVNRSNNFVLGNLISGTGAFQQNGGGTTVLTGANTYTGGTTISAGTLQLGNSGTTGSILGDAINNAAFTINRSDAYTFAGLISGTGAFNQIGTGTTVFTADSTYTGGTTISAGTLQLGNGGSTGSIAGNVTDNGALAFNRSNALAFGGVISGTGAVQQNGTGTTTLTATNTYTGATTVNAGTLLVNGSIASSSGLTVNAGATVGGSGTLPSTIFNGGTLSPGNSIGVININGNLVFGAGSVYTVEVSPTAADRTNVSGTATLNGTVNAIFGPGSYGSNSYTILSAAGGRSGTFSALTTTGLPSFLSASLSYNATDALLVTLVSNIGNVPGLTFNERAVARAQDTAFNGGLATIGALYDLSPAQLPAGLDQLTGEVHASTAGVLVDESLYARSAVLGRLRQASYGGDAGMASLSLGGPQLAFADEALSALAYGKSPIVTKAPPMASRPGYDIAFWAQSFGAKGKFEGDGNAATLRRDLAGFFTGVDARFGDWRGGIAAGYTAARNNLDGRGSANVETGHLAGYGGWSFGALNLRAGGAYAWHTIDTDRTITFPGFFDRATGHYDGGTGQIFGEAGYGFAFGKVAVEPFAGAAWVHLSTDAFNEKGGAAALAVAANTFEVGYSSLGIRAASMIPLGDTMVLVPRVSAVWQHTFSDVTPTATLAFQGAGAPFVIAGVPIARDSLLTEAGLDLAIGRHATLGLSYVGQLARTVQDHAAKGKFAWKF